MNNQILFDKVKLIHGDAKFKRWQADGYPPISTVLTYNDFIGSIEWNAKDKVWHGKFLDISDLVTYEAETLEGLKAAFETEVEDYNKMKRLVNLNR